MFNVEENTLLLKELTLVVAEQMLVFGVFIFEMNALVFFCC